MNTSSPWHSVLTLNEARDCTAGDPQKLVDAIGRGADLRIYTEFRYDEHIDPSSANDELVEEVSEFRVTYLLDRRWVAGIMTLRQPILPPAGFGPRPSMSFFLYNQDGQQAIARPHLDGLSDTADPGPAENIEPPGMPKYRQLDNWDVNTNAPSQNFVYEFGRYEFCVRDDWQEVLKHDARGTVLSGSMTELLSAFRMGCEIKIGIEGLGNELSGNDSPSDDLLPHEVFVQTGPGYFHPSQNLFVTGSHPVVRVCPGIPLQYKSHNWDFGWLMARTDGILCRSLVDPYSLQFTNSETRHSIRWFVR